MKISGQLGECEDSLPDEPFLFLGYLFAAFDSSLFPSLLSLSLYTHTHAHNMINVIPCQIMMEDYQMPFTDLHV